MKRLPAAALIACLVVALAACGGADDPQPKTSSKKKADRVLRLPVPPQYTGKQWPEGMDFTDPDVIAAGRVLYNATPAPDCANCHGDGGKGDGPLAKISPPPDPIPTDLTSDEFQDSVSDQYIYWRIKRGGEGFGGRGVSSMTGFMHGEEEEIWQLVAYVRSLRGK